MNPTVAEMFGLSTSYIDANVPSNQRHQCIVGAELEIESVKATNHHWFENNNVQITSDGSLRNHGKEFLLPPATVTRSIELFNGVHHRDNLALGPDPFTFRTSIHVHVNMMYSKTYQVRNFMLLYSILEPLVFGYVAKERMNNIHCVPLTYTNLPSWYHAPLDILVAKWHKYTALNLLPLRELGTVELRHLEGTNNPEIYTGWLLFIEKLWLVSHTLPSINADILMHPVVIEALAQDVKAIFRARGRLIPYDYRDNLLDVKLSLI